MNLQNRSIVYIGIILLVLGISLYTYIQRDSIPTENFPATAHRDCAPWDGSAFTVQIPLQEGTTIDISIWQSPDILLPVQFKFPDRTGQVGNAILVNQADRPGQLSGTVSFIRVDPSATVEGRFDLRDEAGNSFQGKFSAEWDDFTALCG